MSDRLVYTDRSRVRAGKLEALKTAMVDLVDFVETNEPDILSYDVYFSADGERMTVIHSHADSASLAHHMAVAGPRFPRFAEFVDLESIDVYGRPLEDLVRRLREKAETLGSGRVTVHDRHRGFARAFSG